MTVESVDTYEMDDEDIQELVGDIAYDIISVVQNSDLDELETTTKKSIEGIILPYIKEYRPKSLTQ